MLEPYLLDDSMIPDMITAHKDEESRQVSTPTEIINTPERIVGSFPEDQEINNISKAAYREIMKMAFEAQTWVTGVPALGTLEEFQEMFHSPSPSGMRVDCSIESAVIPISPPDLISILMNVDTWSSVMSPIVYCASYNEPPLSVCQVLKFDEYVKQVLMVDAELHIPTPFIQARKFSFFRFLRRILQDIWAVIDISTDYFPCTSIDFVAEQKCRRRPSGLIIRFCENQSQVVWIENMDVIKLPQDNIFFGMPSAFSARSWICALISRLKRNASDFTVATIQVNREVRLHLLDLAESMKRVFFEISCGVPDEGKWDKLLIQDINILKKSASHGHMSGSNDYIAVTSFRVEAKPELVFDFLAKNNWEIQNRKLASEEDSAELIKLASYDNSSYISLHRKGREYLLNEVSRDGFRNIAISTPMSHLNVEAALSSGRWSDDFLFPSGFVVMADGLKANESLVTITMQCHYVLVISRIVICVHNLIGTVIEQIHKMAKTGN